MRIFLTLVAAAFILTSCGGGGGGSNALQRPSGPQTQPPPAPQPPRTTVPTARFSAVRSVADWRYWWHSPIMQSPNGGIVIGPGVVATELNEANAGELIDTPQHDGFLTAAAHINNGVGRFQMFSYLSDDAADQGGQLLRWGNAPPTVHVVAGATAEQIAETQAVVSLINSALPQEWQLRFNSQPVSGPSSRPDGQIVVQYSPEATWPVGEHRDTVLGRAQWWIYNTGEIVAARVWVDPDRNRTQQRRMEVLAHEMLHALGRGHIDERQFPYSVMHETVNDARHVQGYILHQLDNEALLAVYSRMQPGTPAHLVSSDLGPWESESFNVFALAPPLYGGDQLDINAYLQGLVLFGASERNGAVRPWALGYPFPDTTLVNSRLTGSATWTGRLLGLTTRSEPLAGAAGMTINIETLRGNLAFTGLEKWSANRLPGTIGTGTRWGDGDLDYEIQVSSNGFHRIPGSGSDAGRIEGTFVGREHEGMMGIVDRADMSAGFGGTRQ